MEAGRIEAAFRKYVRRSVDHKAPVAGVEKVFLLDDNKSYDGSYILGLVDFFGAKHFQKKIDVYKFPTLFGYTNSQPCLPHPGRSVTEIRQFSAAQVQAEEAGRIEAAFGKYVRRSVHHKAPVAGIERV